MVVVKIMIGVNLVIYANSRREKMEARQKEDAINDFGRDPIGEGKEEQGYNKELKVLLNDKRNDVSKKARVELEDLTRFTMVKRIW